MLRALASRLRFHRIHAICRLHTLLIQSMQQLHCSGIALDRNDKGQTMSHCEVSTCYIGCARVSVDDLHGTAYFGQIKQNLLRVTLPRWMRAAAAAAAAE
jgi:hypothetical protein